MGHVSVKAHDDPEKQGVYEFLKNAHKFQKICYSGIIPFGSIGKEEIHKYMQYEVSMTAYVGKIANQRKIPKWLPFINYKLESLNI